MRIYRKKRKERRIRRREVTDKSGGADLPGDTVLPDGILNRPGGNCYKKLTIERQQVCYNERNCITDRKERKRMKKAIPVFVAVGLIVLIALGFVGFKTVQKYTPTKELADLGGIYEAEGNEAAILYNYELQETQGIYENGQTYLPLSWINQYLNKRFYWDSTEKLLVYALPEQIVYADTETKGSNGAPLVLLKDDQVYLPLGLIANYTDIQLLAYDKGDVKRVFVNDWGTRTVADVKKNGKVRERGGIKSPIVTEAVQGTQVTVLEQMEKWSRVMTPDGHIGYLENRILEPAEQKEFSGTYSEPVYKGTSLDEKIVMVWHQVTTTEGNKRLSSLLEKTEGVNVVSPTWFSLTDNEGNYTSLASREYVEEAHERGLQVWALLDNFSSDVQTEKLLSSTTTRRKLINSLIEEAEKYGIDGLNMDFESLKPEAGVHYIQFLRELSIPCRQKGIVLSVDNYVPAGYNDFYDREEQGIVADYVIIMGYDEHYNGSDAGSVASIDYVRGGIERTLEEVPKEKIINGVPFYTRIWTETDNGVKSSALGIADAKKWVKDNKVELYWQQELGQYYGELEEPGGIKTVWMEEEDSLREKMNVIKEFDLAGVACWKLGLEDAAAWEAIQW